MAVCFRGGKYSRLRRWCFLAMVLVGTKARFFQSCGSAFAFAFADAYSIGNEKATLASGAFNSSAGSYRQDVCDRYEEMNRKNNTDTITSVRNLLAGMEVTVSIIPGPRFRYNETDGIDPVYPGIEARILDTIALAGNFTWRNSFGVWDRKEIEVDGNRSYTDVLLWGTETFDVVVLDATPTARRINMGISFTLGLADTSLIMVRNVEQESPRVDWLKFLEPFENEVWFAIIGVIVLSSIAYQFIEQVGMDRNRFEYSFRKWVMINLYRSFINFTGNYSYEPTTLGGRIFGFFFAFWAMLISAAYTANLASILVKENYPAPEIRNLPDAIAKHFRICVQLGSAAEEYLRDRYHPEIEEFLVPVEKEDLYKALHQDESNDNRCEITVTKKQEFQTKRWQEESNPGCTLEWQGRVVRTQADSFATKHSPGIKCTDLINEVFSYHMKEMQDSGVLGKLWDEHEEFYRTEDHCLFIDEDEDDDNNNNAGDASSDPKSPALSVKNMAGTMLIQFVGSVIAIVVAVLSRKEERTKIKRRLRRETSAIRNSNNEDNVSALREQVGGLLSQLDCLADYSCRLENLAQKVETMQESFDGKQHKYENEIGPWDEVEKEAELPQTGIVKMRYISMIGEQK